MKALTLALLLTGTLVLTFGLATVAAAPGGNGATVIDIDTCAPLIGGGTVCVTSQGMLHEVVTPSGNESYVSNYREHIRVVDESGAVTWDETNQERFHALTLDDVLHEMRWRARFTVTSSGEPFCLEYHLHAANGEDQFVRIDFCS